MQVWRKIRILVLFHDCSAGGAERSLFDLLSGIDRSRFDAVVAMPCDGALRARVEALGYQVFRVRVDHWLPYRNAKGLRHLRWFLSALPERVRRLRGLIDSEQVDLVYTNTITMLDGAIAAFMNKTPHVWHAREGCSNNPDLGRYLPACMIRWLIRSLSCTLVVNSDALAKQFAKPDSAHKVVTVYNGVDASYFSNAQSIRQELTQGLRIDHNASLVGIIGSLSPRKDHATLFRALARLKSSGLSLTLLVVGGGEASFIDELQGLVRSLGIKDSVRFLGIRTDTREILKSLDVLVLASTNEPFGRVIIEAMAAGTPVVATTSGGPDEIIIDQETGFLVPPGNDAVMSAKIEQLIRDPRLRENFRKAGLTRVETHFSLERYVRSIENVLTNATAK